MTALNLLHSGRIGVESGNLARRARRLDLRSEPLESRRLLSTGLVGAAVSLNQSQVVAAGTSGGPAISAARSASLATNAPSPATVANQVTAAQANAPTDNSSTTNTPSVGAMVPAPLNVVTDDSTSVITSLNSAISVLNPDLSSPATASSDALVFLVPSPGVPSTTIQLSIATPDLEVAEFAGDPARYQLAGTLPPEHLPVNFNASIRRRARKRTTRRLTVPGD